MNEYRTDSSRNTSNKANLSKTSKFFLFIFRIFRAFDELCLYRCVRAVVGERYAHNTLDLNLMQPFVCWPYCVLKPTSIVVCACESPVIDPSFKCDSTSTVSSRQKKSEC